MNVPTTTSPRVGVSLVLAVLIVMGSAARFYALGHDALWSDELFTSSMVLQHPVDLRFDAFRRTKVFGIAPHDTFLTAKAAEQSPPLFELLTKVSVCILGRSELALRFVSALAACLWLVFLAWRALCAEDPRLARTYLWALVFATVSTPFIAYAQECRAYGLGTLLTGVTGAMLFERCLLGRGATPFPRGIELFVMVLACHTHYDALVFVALVLGVYGVVAVRRRDSRALMRLAIVPLACIPWAALNGHTIFFTARGGVAWGDISVVEALRGAFVCASELVGRPLGALVLIATIGALARRVAGGPSTDTRVARTLFALVAFAVVYIVLVGLVTMRAGMMHARFYLFLLPALHLGAGLVVGSVITRLRIAVVVATLFVAASVSDVRAFYDSDREGYREVTRAVRARVPSDTPIVYTHGPNLSVYRYYLERSFGPDADDRAVAITHPDEDAFSCAPFARSPRFVLLAHETHRPLIDAVHAACDARFRMRDEVVLRGVVGQVWTRR